MINFKTYLSEMSQEFHSDKTSVNQIPRVFKFPLFAPGSVNIDWGGGKYDTATNFMKEKYDATNLVYDPFNRTREHNDAVLSATPDTIICCNVFNVIKEDSIISETLSVMSDYKVPIYIIVYAGNGSGIGIASGRGWQRNQKTKDYLKFISSVLPDRTVTLANNLITVK